MWPLADTIEQLAANISRDIATFANPGSEIERSIERSTTALTWMQGRQTRSARFRLTGEQQVLVSVDEAEMGYRAFLGSEQMADLALLAQRTLAMLQKVEPYVMARARIRPDEDELAEAAAPTDEIVRSVCAEPILAGAQIIDATRLLFVRAPAGAGKTAAMRMLARDQASRFLQRQVQSLFLYVDAQGRALSRLNEALAFELQNLGVPAIRYNAVSALVRNRLIVPIIDGFDELIGSGGFADAFGSLSAFLSELGRQGTLVATGRSTFYDDQKFATIAERFSRDDSLNYFLETLELEPWAEREVSEYLDLRFPERAEREKVALALGRYTTTTDARNRELLGKAFFVVQLANTISAEDFRPDRSADLMAQLIDHLLEREVGKLLDRQGDPVLTADGHRLLLQELATEMWWQEVRSVDTETLDAIAELVADSLRLKPEHRSILLGRIRSHALLRTDREAARERRGFEHEMYYDFFLMGALLALVEQQEGVLSAFLARSVLGEALLEQLAAQTQSWDGARVALCLQRLSCSAGSAPKGGLVRRNAGALVAALLAGRTDLPQGIELAHLEMYRTSLDGAVLPSSVIRNCYLSEVGLFRCSFAGSEFPGSVLDRVHLDPGSTRFDGAQLLPGKQVISIVTQSGEAVYDPGRLGRMLTEMGALVPSVRPPVALSQVQEEDVELVKRFIARAKRVLFFDPLADGDDHFRAVTRNPRWPRVWDLLKKAGLVEVRHRDRSGPRSYLYKLAVQPDDLLAGLSAQEPTDDARIGAFWGDLIANQ